MPGSHGAATDPSAAGVLEDSTEDVVDLVMVAEVHPGVVMTAVAVEVDVVAVAMAVVAVAMAVAVVAMAVAVVVAALEVVMVDLEVAVVADMVAVEVAVEVAVVDLQATTVLGVVVAITGAAAWGTIQGVGAAVASMATTVGTQSAASTRASGATATDPATSQPISTETGAAPTGEATSAQAKPTTTTLRDAGTPHAIAPAATKTPFRVEQGTHAQHCTLETGLMALSQQEFQL